jgi:hypothetical protein
MLQQVSRRPVHKRRQEQLLLLVRRLRVVEVHRRALLQCLEEDLFGLDCADLLRRELVDVGLALYDLLKGGVEHYGGSNWLIWG